MMKKALNGVLKGVEQWDKNKLLVARSEDPVLKYFGYPKGQPTGVEIYLRSTAAALQITRIVQLH